MLAFGSAETWKLPQHLTILELNKNYAKNLTVWRKVNRSDAQFMSSFLCAYRCRVLLILTIPEFEPPVRTTRDHKLTAWTKRRCGDDSLIKFHTRVIHLTLPKSDEIWETNRVFRKLLHDCVRFQIPKRGMLILWSNQHQIPIDPIPFLLLIFTNWTLLKIRLAYPSGENRQTRRAPPLGW